MQIKRVKQNIKKLLHTLSVDKAGIDIMANKANVYTFHIKDIRCGAANILKQDALSIGAEFALPYGTIECKNEKKEGVLIGNKRVLLQLCQKLKAQPYGLKDLSLQIKIFLNAKEYDFKIMGVVNANSDSFYSGSRFEGESAIVHMEKLINDGADIIDLGGVSSRPGSVYCGVEEELKRIKPILKLIGEKKLYQKAVFSIDSFEPKVIKLALQNGFKIVNDITGLDNEKVASLAKDYGAKVCIMHMQKEPSTMQKDPNYEDVVLNVERFFSQRIDTAKRYGLDEKDIILDVGIGFGKTLEHNLELLLNLNHFQKFGCELLIGASRKSMINKIYKSEPKDRLSGTLALHLKAWENGASIIRVHDVYEHAQALSVCQKMHDY